MQLLFILLKIYMSDAEQVGKGMSLMLIIFGIFFLSWLGTEVFKKRPPSQ